MIQRWIHQTFYGEIERDPAWWTHDTNGYDYHDHYPLTIATPYTQMDSNEVTIDSLLKVSLRIEEGSNDNGEDSEDYDIEVN